ncbi:Apolipoprotein A-V [Frankliniella fusca]|uniref:Apolipoprotein A-V n=1 Tax=Frankliniella fusca TaxID=407009 RepID=A0AAE1GU84_9NEOP|nr:Apolipoprotein A-V [Frankliniella fusca]
MTHETQTPAYKALRARVQAQCHPLSCSAQPNMAGRGSAAPRPDMVHVMGVAVALFSLLLAVCAAPEPRPEQPEPPEQAAVTRQRRSDDYDNMDNFLMGSSDYDNFFLKTAKSVPRIGRRSSAAAAEEQEPQMHVDRRSTDANELVPSYANGYDHFFLKASKSVPRIGKRNDEFFMKTAKSVPRIGRRSGDGPDNFLLKKEKKNKMRKKIAFATQGREQNDYLKTAGEPRLRRSELEALQPPGPGHRVDRRSRARAQVEDGEWPAHGALGGNDAVLGRQRAPHRIQRRNFDERMAKAAKTVPRMGKRMHPALDEVGDWGTEQQWPWFRQQDTQPGPYKRVPNPADFIDLSQVPWESLDQALRQVEARRGLGDDDKHLHDVMLIEGDKQGEDGDKWAYTVADKKDRANKELEEARFQPDVNKRK